ncbi:MAG: DUF4331 family protein [Candidatus Sericytochromatia bacterium]
MKILALALTLGATLVGMGLGANYVTASDHDDGTTDMKTQNTNLTDLYVFREQTQNPMANPDDLIFIMNSNPRSLARQQYYFNTNARYEFHVTQLDSNDETPSGEDDVILRFEFEQPDENMQQAFRVTAIRDGQEQEMVSSTTGASQLLTTPLDDTPINNELEIGNENLTVFAGLREDPFFFDVEQFFRVRDAAAQGMPGSVVFRDPGLDFTAGYNVLSIVARIPRSFLQVNGSGTSFDVWETISVEE